jgi:hypothetical protein
METDNNDERSAYIVTHDSANIDLRNRNNIMCKYLMLTGIITVYFDG